MHNNLNIYYFINNFNSEEIKKLNKRVSIIYRNYSAPLDLNLIKKIRDICALQKRKFFIANNLKIAKNLRLDGVYIPSFNRLANLKNLNVHKEFKIIGSAHNNEQLTNKRNQGCTEIFIAPIFKTKKNNLFLGVTKFNLLSKSTNIKVIALGGIDGSNYKKLRLTSCFGFAAIGWIKKTGLTKLGRFLNF